MKWLLAFVAGFASPLVLHQALLELPHLAGISPRPAWNMAAMPSPGVPGPIFLMFRGSLWGTVPWAPIRNMRNGINSKPIDSARLLNGMWEPAVVGPMKLYRQG